MRNYIISICLLLLAGTSWSQANASVFESIGSGDAELVSSYMDDNIEICFDDRIDFMTKIQAKRALASFYKENPPLSFKALHKGNSKGADSKYMIGQYRSQNARNFRVYIFVKNTGTQTKIQEIRFDIQK